MNTDRFKFRVWSEKLKRYYWNYAINVDGDLVPWMSNHKEEDVGEKLIREQCTGLRDRNDELIYEGDVLKVPAFFGGFVNMRVVWDDNNCRWDLHYSCKRSTAKDMTVLVLELGNASEIIGNIHETEVSQ